MVGRAPSRNEVSEPSVGLAGQNRVLERIATGAALADVLGELVRVMDEELPAVSTSILLVDGPLLRFGAAGAGVAPFSKSVDGIAWGPTVGACGAAVSRRETVRSDDVEADPLWTAVRDPLRALGLRSCLSVPVLGRSGDRPVLATFAIFGRNVGVDERNDHAVAQACELARIAIEADHAARQLRTSEERLRGYIDHAGDALFVHASDGRVRDVNLAACASLGYTREELIGKRPELFDPGLTPERSAEIERRIAAGETVSFDTFHRRKDGVVFPVMIRIRAIAATGDVLAIGRDMTERVAAERALERAQALAHVGSWTYDRTTEMWSASPEFWRICGFAGGPQSATDLLAIVHPDDRKHVLQTTAATIAGTACVLEHRIIVGGETRWLEVRTDPGKSVDGRVTAITGTSQDVTNRRRLEDQLRQKQKLEAIGRLAGGVAHDFNNILTVINALSDELLSDPSLVGERREDMMAIRDAGQRAGALTAQLLAFSRRSILAPMVIDVNAAIDKLGAMLRRLIGADVRLTIHRERGPTAIDVDPGQFDQMIINLVLNARDAMPVGGNLTLATRRFEGAPGVVDSKPFVEIRVDDTGVGMTDEVKANLFEPFFTTKEAGKGTGLGLATVYGIVQQMGGQIAVESELGRGSKFSIKLPASTRADAAARAKTDTAKLPAGDGTVLVVEDEPALRRLVCRVLRDLGFVVVEACDGVDACNVLDAHPGPIDLLLTDVVMPRMGGREIADRVRTKHPGVKTLYMSGYTNDEILRQGVTLAERAFLQKPFTRRLLAEKVFEVMKNHV